MPGTASGQQEAAGDIRVCHGKARTNSLSWQWRQVVAAAAATMACQVMLRDLLCIMAGTSEGESVVTLVR